MNKLEAQKIGNEMVDEALRASSLFPHFNSGHEGLAIILEEYEELKAEIFKRQSDYDYQKMKKEAEHIGAMALRFIYDICNPYIQS